MAKIIIFAAVCVSVQGNAILRAGGWTPTPGWTTPPPTTTPGWSEPPTTPGWSEPTTTPGWSEPATTPGWSEPATTPGWSEPPTTPGWTPPPTEPPTEPPTTTPGWSPPPVSTPGWGSAPANNISINLDGALGAIGVGWAAENHAENIQVTGGWGISAELAVSAGGESLVGQQGSIVQLTNVDPESASSLNAVSVEQIATADEGLAVIASGADILVDQIGSAAAAGQGVSAAVADTTLLVNQ